MIGLLAPIMGLLDVVSGAAVVFGLLFGIGAFAEERWGSSKSSLVVDPVYLFIGAGFELAAAFLITATRTAIWVQLVIIAVMMFGFFAMLVTVRRTNRATA